jgi:hypothetical protein
VEGVLAGSDGKVDPSWIKSPFELIRSGIKVEPMSTVKIPAGAMDKKPVKELIVRARMDLKTLGGGNFVMQVKLNGKLLGADRIRNRLDRIQLGNEQIASSMGGSTWFILYAPNYDPIPPYSGYATPGIDPYELRFDVSDLWKSGGGNEIEIADTAQFKNPIMAEVGASEMLSPKIRPPELKPAPTGEIPTLAPITEGKPDYSWRQLAGGAFEVTLGQKHWVVESQFSTTTPGWAKLGRAPEAKPQWKSFELNKTGLSAVARDFKLKREITRHDDHLQIVDHITNTSNADLPVMFSHQTEVDRTGGKLFIAGLEVKQPKLFSDNGVYPATWIGWDKDALGWVGEDDITRAQGGEFVDGNTIGIRDDHMVVGRGKTIDLEFSIYPLETPERYAFINRIRRNWDMNFTINGAGIMQGDVGASMNIHMTDERLKDYLLCKSAYYMITGSWISNFDIPSWKISSRDETTLKMADRVHALRPDIVRLDYVHCFLGYQPPWDLTEANVKAEKALFKEDAILRPDGTPADYSNPDLPLFLPTEGSKWAKAQESLFEYRLKNGHVEGLYWDEMAYSAFRYDYNPNHWDGVSADIDPTTHRIARKITNVTLASQPWRLRMAKKLLDRGPLLANGGPFTRSFGKLHFPRFEETGLFTNIVNGQLNTPIALGDHLTERNEVDAFKDMVRGLDYGSVYYWYRPEVDATYPTLTSYMYPITPINLGHGYIIGKERILTNTSGYFDWGDQSDFEPVVFDRRGMKTDAIKIPKVERDGKVFAEVRIPEGYAVALIRKQKQASK